VEEVCEVCGGHGGCVDAAVGVAVASDAAAEVLLQWVLGHACSGGDSGLIEISHVRQGIKSGSKADGTCGWKERGFGDLESRRSATAKRKSIPALA
jgi:hypothetical protein